MLSHDRRSAFDRVADVSDDMAIVGASSGIGLALARLAAQEGAHLAMLSRSADKLEAATQGLSGNVRARPLDMLDRTETLAAAAWMGMIDHLVLTAAADELMSRGPIESLSPEQVERSFDKLRVGECRSGRSIRGTERIHHTWPTELQTALG